MGIIEQYEEDDYIIRKYENGNVEKIIKSDNLIIPQFTEQEIVNSQILNKLEYLECLLELSAMKGGN